MEFKVGNLYRVTAVRAGEYLTAGVVYECTSVDARAVGLHRPYHAAERPGAGTVALRWKFDAVDVTAGHCPHCGDELQADELGVYCECESREIAQ